MRSREKDESASETSSLNETSNQKPLPVWVDHTPTPDDTSSTGGTSSTSPYPSKSDPKSSLKSRLQSLLRLNKKTENDESDVSASGFQILPNGTRVSPPVSPLLGRKHDLYQSDSSQNSDKNFLRYEQEDSLLTSIHPAEYYAEKVEIYNLKYAYLKSWPGLLRLLAGLELLFGGMVFACIIAYIQKDSEWSNAYGIYNGAYNNGYGISGYSYHGPMTPFVLAITGVSWIITFVLLVAGMTMYYRTILLDSRWWPLTEAFVNVTMFLLYMSAGIVYLNDLNRGGLCFSTIGVNPIMASLCRVEGGQMAGTAFIFINMVLYLGSFLVCLKMWRHEAARREREYCLNEPSDVPNSIPLVPHKPKQISFRDQTETDHSKSVNGPEAQRPPVKSIINKSGATKTCIIADYIMKYPEITCLEQREEYRAVFNDQYQEYRDLHRHISLTLSKFRQLDMLMDKLLRDSTQNPQRIQSLLQTLEEKKNDPTFWEKKQRCDYLKAKLSHLKSRIHTFDQTAITDKKKQKMQK
ncbi:hypothetical protein NQD34_013113 [Periophthalmus magnuspinnatus]|nr:hypothetical protein NQD34_013113 [Periophthalmus magnuspinnatus]